MTPRRHDRDRRGELHEREAPGRDEGEVSERETTLHRPGFERPVRGMHEAIQRAENRALFDHRLLGRYALT